MGTNVYQIHADSIAAVQSYLGDDCPSVSWDGEDWPVIPGSAGRRKDLVAGGFDLNADLRFNALTCNFPGDAEEATDIEKLIVQKDIEYLGDKYRIIRVSILPGGFQLEIEANSSTQGA